MANHNGAPEKAPRPRLNKHVAGTKFSNISGLTAQASIALSRALSTEFASALLLD